METMKLVLSRKGFDSVYGGVPSPILPDGRLCYLPIPGDNGNSTCCFSDIQRTDYDLANIVFDLTRGRLSGDNWVHLDPDLRKEDLPRSRGWRPCFGQASVAQAHLDNMGVGPGDLFLFFGWFRKAECRSGKWRYVPNAPDLHVIFGWLEIAKKLVGTDIIETAPVWAQYHPHVHFSRDYHDNNTLIVGTSDLGMLGRKDLAGGGLFPRHQPILQLSDGELGRSTWRLPSCFAPRSGAPLLSYHTDEKRWKRSGDEWLLRVVGRGQEFILDLDHYPGVYNWLAKVFRYTK